MFWWGQSIGISRQGSPLAADCAWGRPHSQVVNTNGFSIAVSRYLMSLCDVENIEERHRLERAQSGWRFLIGPFIRPLRLVALVAVP